MATGLRVDGRDGCTQGTFNGIPINTILTATSGHIRWDWVPRRGHGTWEDFVEAGHGIFIYVGNAADYIEIRTINNTTLRLTVRTTAGGVVTQNFGAAGVVAGTNYLAEIKYTSTQIEFLVDSVQLVLIATPIAFATIPATVYWGSDNSEANQGDAVFAAPTP